MKLFNKEFIRFVIVGVIATALHYGIYYVLESIINVNIAYTIGYFLSFIANFYMTSYFTFKVAPSWKRLIGMSGAHIVNYLIQITLLNIFIKIGIPAKFAPIPVYAIAVPVNFLLVRFVFKYRSTGGDIDG